MFARKVKFDLIEKDRDRGFLPRQETVAVPQIVVYNPKHKPVRNLIAHWLSPDGTTFCGRNPKRSVGLRLHAVLP